MSDPGTRPLVLLAEDEPVISIDLQAALEEAGFAVRLAPDGAQALALIETEGEAIRALVTDVNLGRGPNGWDVAHAGRERNPGLGVVYVTSADSSEWAANGVPNSVFVSKPFANAQIVVAVSELLNAEASPQAG